MATPLAPTLRSPTPADGTIHTSDTGTTLLVSGTHRDPGDHLARRVQARVWNDAQTSILRDQTFDLGTRGAQRFNVTVTSLPRRTWGRLETRTQCIRTGKWGAWTTPRRRVRTNARPKVAFVTILEDSEKPRLLVSISDPDGNQLSAIEWYVYEDVTISGKTQTITRWYSGKVEIGGLPSRAELEYGGGENLVRGGRYRSNIYVWDADDVPSRRSGPHYFRARDLAFTLIPNGTDTKVGETRPWLDWVFSAAHDQFQIEVYDNPDGLGTPLYRTAVIAQTSATSGSHKVTKRLPHGQEAWWRIHVRPTGTSALTEWSDLAIFYINAAPYKPVIEVAA
jgi:hypothetical protein